MGGTAEISGSFLVTAKVIRHPPASGQRVDGTVESRTEHSSNAGEQGDLYFYLGWEGKRKPPHREDQKGGEDR